MSSSLDDSSQGQSRPGFGGQGYSSPDTSHAVSARLNAALQAAGMVPLEPKLGATFAAYLSLILRWNQRINLTAIRDEGEIIARHFVESIACAHALPGGIATLLDLGSGAGFPGIPIALCRPEISVTLADSQGKKAAFLQEAVRVLGIQAKVHGRRAEELSTVFDCVTLRAVDRMPDAVRVAAGLVRDDGWLALMTTESEAPVLQSAASSSFVWTAPIPLPGSVERVIVVGHKNALASAQELAPR